MTDIQKWADAAMFPAEPIEKEKDATHVMPKVYLLWMTPDPLGALAAMNFIYSGRVIRSLSELTNEDRKYHWEQTMRAHLEAPLEAIKFHFLIEGVDRGFTHQLVRQRTAVYAQESLRFAVKENMAAEVVVPPHLLGLPDDHPKMMLWRRAIEAVEESYSGLVDSGLPAEDARSLLPTATATRVHYITDLRGLKLHAGNRLCTQAQFHWRLVFNGIVSAIRNYGHQLIGEHFCTQTGQHPNDLPLQPGDAAYDKALENVGGWQFETISDSMLFRPVCFHLNRCPWRDDIAAMRTCSIRAQVDILSDMGVPSSKWESDQPIHRDGTEVEPIRPEDWLMDPDSAIRTMKDFQDEGRSV